MKNEILFTGRWLDKSTNLYYYRARWYDAEDGRFVSKDPIGFDSGDWNLYRYVGNNSVNKVDEMGLQMFQEWDPTWPKKPSTGQPNLLGAPCKKIGAKVKHKFFRKCRTKCKEKGWKLCEMWLYCQKSLFFGKAHYKPKGGLFNRSEKCGECKANWNCN